MGFVRIFRKKNVQEAYLQKMSISEQIIICLWDVSQLYTENSIQTLLIFWELTQKNLEGFVWSFLSIAGLRYQRQFAPKCWFLASRPPGHCSFRISWQIPQISFLWRRTLVLYFQVNYLKYTRMDVQDCISTIRTHLKRSQQIIGIGIFLSRSHIGWDSYSLKQNREKPNEIRMAGQSIWMRHLKGWVKEKWKIRWIKNFLEACIHHWANVRLIARIFFILCKS